MAKLEFAEREVGEKRQAAEDLWCSEEEEDGHQSCHWISSVPPLSWRTYFQITGIEERSAIPEDNMFAPAQDSEPFLSLLSDLTNVEIPLENLDEPGFYLPFSEDDFWIDENAVIPFEPYLQTRRNVRARIV